MDAAFWFRAGAIWAFLAVAMGAFGAHGLQAQFLKAGEIARMPTEQMIDRYHTASQYHMYCALGMLAVAAVALHTRPGTATTIAGLGLLLGSLIFSGTLYAYAILGLRWLGMITPIGGVAMMIGWLALAVAGGGAVSATRP